MPHNAALTGHPSKKQELKTNFALITGIGIVAFAALGYVLVKHRAVLAKGAGAITRELGPIVSRVLPALILGTISLIFGPEALLVSIPLGLFLGPEILSMLGGGGSDDKKSGNGDSGSRAAVNALAAQSLLSKMGPSAEAAAETAAEVA